MRPIPKFKDRQQAGRDLASTVKSRCDSASILLALPRGGVPIAYEIAKALGSELDVFLVRKLGVPHHEELAMGALASHGIVVLNQRMIAALEIPQVEVDLVLAKEKSELRRREALYRQGRPTLDLAGKSAILVDDGLATGSTMMAAIKALRKLEPARITVAVPVSAPDAAAKIQDLADELICLSTPDSFRGVGEWYANFDQVTDDEVLDLLHKAAAARGEQAPTTGL